jgi:hypothetical protein
MVFTNYLDLFAFRRAEMTKLFYRVFSISRSFPYTQTLIIRREKYMKTLINLLPAVLLFIFLFLEPAFAGGPPIQWQKTFGGTGGDSAHSVQQTHDGGYIITGSTSSFGPGDPNVYLIKTDPNGNSQWQKTFGESNYTDRAYSAQQTADGGYVIAGYTNSYGAGWSDVYLIKICSDGTLSADFNCNGTVYYEDLAILADEWLQPPVMLSADIFPESGDNIVNAFDFAALAQDWLQSTIP